MKHEELKPCPFCGKKADTIEDCIGRPLNAIRYHVGCVNPACIVCPQTRMKAFEEEIPEMIKAWNKRANK